MKANSVAAATKQPGAPAPLIPLRVIVAETNGGYMSEALVRDALRAPGAPKPVLGGDRRGSRGLWSREAVEKYFAGIAKSGKWPVAEREAA